jgi:hypothetical protein
MNTFAVLVSFALFVPVVLAVVMQVATLRPYA